MTVRCVSCSGSGRVIYTGSLDRYGSRYARCVACGGRGYLPPRGRLESGDTLVWDLSSRRLVKKADGTIWREEYRHTNRHYRLEWVALPAHVWKAENTRRKNLGYPHDSEEATPTTPRKDKT